MSDRTPKREWKLYIDDMLQFSEKVLRYTQGQTKADFLRDELRYDATIRNLELIGEAATHIPDPIRKQHPDIPWRQIVATRNQIIHNYLGIDNDTIWSIITDDLPGLMSQLDRIRQEPD
ncbi:MAG: DUF86 domain-containing protein [Geitlerinemataceae cyanobacterium]